LAAFAAARAQGADGVECDVRSTRDGVLVIHHDPAPADADPGTVLALLDHVEVARRWPTIPTLEQTLDECRDLVVNVEIKNVPWEAGFDPTEATATAVVGLLAARAGVDQVVVSSFHVPSVDRVHELDGAIPTGVLFSERIDFASMVQLAIERGHTAVHPGLAGMGEDAEGHVREAYERGLEVNVWTVNEPTDLVRLAALGASGLITDVPDVARRALGR